ncbi:MAG: sugar phosphate nucleotidyltransferase [Candidatus Omnitrophota bacterium]|nr:NTP transferase domain-containing protein [Candidatus Omnitrophota bacterium]
MKVLLLAAGRGKRLGKVSEGINKCLLLVQNKPLIEYSLDAVAALAAVSEIVIVVGYKAQDIIARYGSAYRGKPIVYVRQGEQHGLVHAIECAKLALGASDFMLMLGDEFMVNARHAEFIEAFGRERAFALCGVVSVADKSLISKTYSVLELPDGRIVRLIEKPAKPLNNIMGTGNCIFKNEILSYINRTPINQSRQEKELPDLIQCAVDDGHMVKTFSICTEYINVNSQEELNKTTSYFAHL